MSKKIAKIDNSEKDSLFILKLTLFFLLGCLWIDLNSISFPIPVGFLLGLVFAMHEHFMIDKKLEYAILLIATVMSFVAPIGFVLTVG